MMPSEHPVREAFRASVRHALNSSQIVEHADGLLAVDDRGRIAACGSYAQLAPRLSFGCPVRDWRGYWIAPGFVDTHCHLPQLDCRNKNGLTLLDWLKTYIYPAEAEFADPKRAAAIAPRFFDQLLRHGITTAAVYNTVHFESTEIAFQTAKEKGLRAIIGQVLMDRNAPESLLKPAKQLLAESEKLILKWHGAEKRLFFALTPRFALTCSDELIRGAGKMAEEAKCYFQTHLAETREEVAQARDLFQFKNYSGFYADRHCVGRRSLFAHAIHLRGEEWDILGEGRSALCHCPTSNVFLKSGTMPAAEVERRGIRYGFGTDVGAGPTFSLREVADCALKVHPEGVMTPEKAFYLATLGGAEALSMEKEIGNFVEGKQADFALFDNEGLRGEAAAVYVAGSPVWKAS